MSDFDFLSPCACVFVYLCKYACVCGLGLCVCSCLWSPYPLLVEQNMGPFCQTYTHHYTQHTINHMTKTDYSKAQHNKTVCDIVFQDSNSMVY